MSAALSATGTHDPDRVRATIGWATRILERGVGSLPERASTGEVIAALSLALGVYLCANVEPACIDETLERATQAIAGHVAACRPAMNQQGM